MSGDIKPPAPAEAMTAELAFELKYAPRWEIFVPCRRPAAPAPPASTSEDERGRAIVEAIDRKGA